MKSTIYQVFITGATGNIGSELISFLTPFSSKLNVIAGVRKIEKAKKYFHENSNLQFRSFDFENKETFSSGFEGIDILFLLRPPHISEVEKYFKPLLESAQKNGIKKVIFLSVQGAEKSKVIPHNKIERLIRSMDFDWIFVRPSYFMQNLTTSLAKEIKNKKSLTLPSGNGVFNWVDTKNIGEATAELIANFENHQNKAFEITGDENLTFGEVVELMNEVLPSPVIYKSINPIRFYFKKKKEGLSAGYAMVMTILHFLPRLQKAPLVSNSFRELTKKNPTSIRAFIEREKNVWL